MTSALPTHGLQLRSLIKSSGELELSLATVDVAAPVGDEIAVALELKAIVRHGLRERRLDIAPHHPQ